MPRMYNIIDTKKRGLELSTEHIKWVIDSYVKNEIPDYQMSALLMAIYLKGMTSQETADLTDAMLYSGKTIQFADHDVIDKHSTGGIGDKASFILAPIAAACGVKVPMMAGRGLGFTGGTVDKIEAIGNFQTNMSLEDFKKMVETDGLSLIGQTDDIAPADKLIYALRDVTATIESIPLITASIMSKKLAEGSQGIVMDVKTGSGAFMQKESDAKALAQSILKTASRFNKKASAFITNMDQPLGHKIGHSHEIIESIETLKGKGPEDLTELSLLLASEMIYLADKAKSRDEAKAMAKQALTSGAALKEFKELIERQGGDAHVIEDYSRLPCAKDTSSLTARSSGYLKSFINSQLGLALVELGGGRKSKSDQIDFGVGITLNKKVGERVEKGEPILTFHHHTHQKEIVLKIIQNLNEKCIVISEESVPTGKLIIQEILYQG